MILKYIIDFFNLEGGTRPHIVNIIRPKMLFNYILFFVFRKFNFLKIPYKPINLMVEISTRCNLLCPTCERELFKMELNGLPHDNVKLENIKQLAPILPYIYSVYLVSGIGEPFLNPEFWDIHKFFKSFRIKTGYFTNATFLTKDLIEKTFKEQVNTVTVSIDTFEKDKYCGIKKGADYAKTTEVISSFSYYKRKLNAKYFSLGLNFIFRKDNYKDILEYLDFAHKLGVDYVHCTTIITHLERDKELSFFLVPQDEQKKILLAAKKKAKELKIGIRLPHLSINPKQTCGYLWRCLSVFYNGDVGACPFFRTDRNFYYHIENSNIIYKKRKVGNTIVGNYLNEEIGKIWNGEKIISLRKGQINNKFALSPCDSCYYKYNLH